MKVQASAARWSWVPTGARRGHQSLAVPTADRVNRPALPAAFRRVLGLAPAWLISLALLFAVGTAHAEDADKEAAARALRDAAKVHYDARRYDQAASLYLSAFEVTSNPAYLFNAARSEQRSYRLDDAEKHFRQFIALSAEDRAGVKRAELHLSEITDARAAGAGRRPAAAPVAPKQAPPPVVVPKPAPPPVVAPQAPVVAASPEPSPAPAPAGSWRGPVGWTAIGLGGVAVAAGTWLLLDANSDAAALDDRIHAKGGPTLSFDEAVTETDTINGHITRGWAVAGAGAACALVGAWLLAGDGPADAAHLSPVVGPRLVGFVLGF